MRRSGYSGDLDPWALIKWRGQVASAIRGRRGQAFLRELLDALDAMPEKRLIRYDLRRDGEVCAIGSLGVRRGVDLEHLAPEEYAHIAAVFGIASPLVREIEYINDELVSCAETPEGRWQRVRDWVVGQIVTAP